MLSQTLPPANPFALGPGDDGARSDRLFSLSENNDARIRLKFRHETLSSSDSVDLRWPRPSLRKARPPSMTPRRFLAGMPVRGPLEPLTKTRPGKITPPRWRARGTRRNTLQIRPIRSWMLEQCPRVLANSSNTAYYMFSGPDFLYANALLSARKHLHPRRPRARRPGARPLPG